MKQIIFPGNFNQPSTAEYGIFFERDDSYTRHASIVVVQTYDRDLGTSLINSDEGRNNVLNRILDHDLNGVRIDFISFYLIYATETQNYGFKFPIHWDLDDYIKRGNPYDTIDIPPSDFRSTVLTVLGKGEKQHSVHSYNVVGGCARFYMEFEEREFLSVDENARLLQAVKYTPENLVDR